MKIIFGEKEFKPFQTVHNKMQQYHENPDELVIDLVILGAVTVAIERVAYAVNAVTRAKRTFS